MIPDRQVSTTRSGPETRNIGAAIAGMVSLSRHVSLGGRLTAKLVPIRYSHARLSTVFSYVAPDATKPQLKVH